MIKSLFHLPLFFTLLISIILISISCKDDLNEPINQKPVILSINANPESVKINEETTLTCTASDPDGDALSIEWNAQEGIFPLGNIGSSVKWKAPTYSGSYLITATVSDEIDFVEATVTINVEDDSSDICPPFITYGGKVYQTVRIVNQCWLKENLNIGVMINGVEDQRDNGIIEKYCYDDKEVNCDTNGGLYQWDEAMQYVQKKGTQGLCPPGWHIPTTEDFMVLLANVNYDGNALKALGEGTGIGVGTNTSGFSAILSGYRYLGNFFLLNNNASFWSSNENNNLTANNIALLADKSNVTFYVSDKSDGFCIRCIKD